MPTMIDFPNRSAIKAIANKPFEVVKQITIIASLNKETEGENYKANVCNNLMNGPTLEVYRVL